MTNLLKKSFLRMFLDLSFSLVISFCIFIISINFALIFKPLYYFDIDFLNIEQNSGFERKEIIKNYDYLINYNLDIANGEFHLPSIPYSQNGKTHFEEVKDIFTFLNKALLIGSILSSIFICFKIKKKSYTFINYIYRLLFIIPIFLGIIIFLNFKKSFDIFHELLFSNSYWIFDSTYDPIIKMLPNAFFMHETILILFVIFPISILLKYIQMRLLKVKKNE